MHTTCIGLQVVQRIAVSADPAIRLIVETPPVSVRRLTQTQTQTCLFDIIISRNTIYLTCRMICRETPIKTMCRSHRGHI